MKKMGRKSTSAKRAASKSRAVQDAVEFAASARETSAPVESRTANEFRKLLTSDGIESIVRADLRSVCENLRDDLRRRCDGHGIAIFDTDFDEDVRLIAAHVLAFDIVLKYYGHSS